MIEAMKKNLVVTAVLLVALALPALAGGKSNALEGAVININTAGVEELVLLPGIGESTAARIVAHREAHGRFESVEELMNVRGIGERSLDKLSPFVTLTGPTRLPDPSR